MYSIAGSFNRRELETSGVSLQETRVLDPACLAPKSPGVAEAA